MGGNKKTTEFLKECLADALIQLLQIKPIEKITVPEIAGTANVGRTTYFRHFSSKNELLTFKLIRLWERWGEEHLLSERRKYDISNANSFFQFNYSIRELLLLIYESNLQSVIYDAFYQIMMPQHGANAIDCYKCRFFSYGLFGLLDEWVKRGFYETPDEMAKTINELVTDNL